MPKQRSLESHLYERLFGAFPVSLAVVDRELVVQYSNRKFRRLFAAVKGDVAGSCILKFPALVEIENLVGCAGKEMKSKEAEVELKLPKGVSAFLKTTIIPFWTNSSLDPVFLVTLEDVSERVHLEEQLLQAEKLSTMGQMAASIAHELGNPLSVMITSLEYLRHSLQDSDKGLQEELEIMRENAERMHELLTSLADLSGLHRLQVEKEDIRKAIIPVLAFVRKMAEKAGITVEADLAPELPPCLIDLRQLKQVFLNLLKNAIEAMPDGGTITVRSRYRASLPEHPPAKAWAGAHTQTGGISKAPGFVIVEVEDTGRGISPAQLETIFKPFLSTKKKGMGLGLSLCRGIIEKQGGKIWATSKGSDKGSCFTVEIPVDNGL